MIESTPISNIYLDKKMQQKYLDIELPTALASRWKDKSWFAFGTSITDTSYVDTETNEVTGKYVPYLAALSGLIVTNKGIAGGTIGTGGIYGGSGNILQRILTTNVSGADLITIEGFVNDYAYAVPIGSIGDTGNTTICGALYQAISYCIENSNATIVLFTDTQGKEYTLKSGQTVSCNILDKNSLGLYQIDYNKAIIDMAKFMGVHVIDAGGKSQINNLHPEYIIDQIHHTELGGKQYAYTIWEDLKNIHCNNDVAV